MALKAKVKGRAELMRRLSELAPNAEKYAADAKLQVVKEAANLISAQAPHDSGEYMYNIKGERQADNPNHAPIVGRMSKDPNATAVYAPFIWRFLEFGTKAHNIKAKSGGFLRFTGRDGGTISARSVSHPGTMAQPHIFPVWNDFKPKAKKKINAAINRAVREVQGK